MSSAFHRFSDFLSVSSPFAGSTSIVTAQLAYLGFGTTNDQDVNPQELAADPIADFLFVYPEPAAVGRSVAANLGLVVYSTTNEMLNVVLPFLSASVGGNASTFSYFRAESNALNFVGAGCFGLLSDRFGPKIGLLLSHASAAAHFVALVAADSVSSLYLSAVPYFFIHPLQSAMTVTSLNSDRATRASALGRVGGLAGLGLLKGGVLLVGALLVMKPNQVPTLAAGMEIAILGLIAFTYPEDDVSENEGGTEEDVAEMLTPLAKVVSRPGVAPVLALKTILVSAAGAITFMIQQFAMQPFRFSEHEVGVLTAYVGGVQIVSQLLVSDKVSAKQLYLTIAACVGGSLIGMGVSTLDVPEEVLQHLKHNYLLWLTPLTLSFYSANTMLSSLLTMYVPQEEMGTVLGLAVGTMPLGNMVGCLFAGQLYTAFGFAAVPLSAGAVLTGATTCFYLVDYMPPELSDKVGEESGGDAVEDTGEEEFEDQIAEQAA